MLKLNKMAITYQFHCGICQASDKFFVGNTIEGQQKGEPDFELACCDTCKTLTHTNNKSCPQCGKQAEEYPFQLDSWKFTWYKFLEQVGIKKSKYTGFRIISLEENTEHHRIYCPRCRQMAVKAMPILFYE